MASITPECSCGWVGTPSYAYNDDQLSDVQRQEKTHLKQHDGSAARGSCFGGNCPICNPQLAAELEAEIADADAKYRQPPCRECGAMTPEEAETKCRCGGDKDDCHGCHLWPD